MIGEANSSTFQFRVQTPHQAVDKKQNKAKWILIKTLSPRHSFQWQITTEVYFSQNIRLVYQTPPVTQHIRAVIFLFSINHTCNINMLLWRRRLIVGLPKSRVLLKCHHPILQQGLEPTMDSSFISRFWRLKHVKNSSTCICMFGKPRQVPTIKLLYVLFGLHVDSDPARQKLEPFSN